MIIRESDPPPEVNALSGVRNTSMNSKKPLNNTESPIPIINPHKTDVKS